MSLTEAEIVSIVRHEINQAQGYDSDTLATKREKALEYYQCIMPAPAAGRSAVVSADVADSVHGLLGEIQPIMKSTMVEFVPDSEQDEQQAQAESDFTRDAISRANGWRVLFSACHDALLVGNGWLKVTAEDDTKVTERVYPPGLSEFELMAVTRPEAEGEQIKVKANSDAVTVTRTTTRKRLKFEAIPPEQVLFAEHNGLDDLQQLRFVGERKLFTVSQLREMRISQERIDKIPDATSDYWPGIVARQGIYADQSDNQAMQEAEILKEVFCCYIRLDLDGTNKSALRYVWLGGNELLKNESADHIPYITGSPVPMPHRVQGFGLYELVASVQESKTHILRNYLDNLAVMNASRVGAVEGQVNMNDLTNGRINGVVRMRSPDAIVPLPSADIGPQAMAGLDYMDRVRASRVGSTVDFNEVQAQVMGSSATAAAGQLAKVEKMAGWFANNLVQTLLVPAFLMVHRLMRKEMAGPVMAKVRGKWQQSDTRDWPERELTEVTMGMTTAEKAARISALTQVIQQQAMILQMGGGGVLVDNGRIYNAMADWIRASDLPRPEEYLIDPTSEESQQAQQAAAQQEEQAQQQQVQFTVQYQRWSDLLDAELKEADITSKAVIETRKLSKPDKSEADEAA